jgi:hypothetical protein
MSSTCIPCHLQGFPTYFPVFKKKLNLVLQVATVCTLEYTVYEIYFPAEIPAASVCTALYATAETSVVISRDTAVAHAVVFIKFSTAVSGHAAY